MIVATWQKSSRKHRLVFSLLPTTHFASLMHVCSLSGSPCSDFLLHVLPRLSHVRVELLTTPIIVNTTNLASNHCLPACSCHSNTAYQSAAYTRPSNRPYFDTVLPRPLQNGNATRHIAASSFEPSKHFLSAHALLHPLPLPLLLSLPKPSHIPLHLLGHRSR